jgi:MFS family permease
MTTIFMILPPRVCNGVSGCVVFDAGKSARSAAGKPCRSLDAQLNFAWISIQGSGKKSKTSQENAPAALAKQRSALFLMRIGFGARTVAIAILAVTFISQIGGLTLILVGFVALVLAWPLLAVSGTALAAELAPTEKGEALGLFNASSSLAGAVGAFLGGWGMEMVGYGLRRGRLPRGTGSAHRGFGGTTPGSRLAQPAILSSHSEDWRAAFVRAHPGF